MDIGPSGLLRKRFWCTLSRVLQLSMHVVDIVRVLYVSRQVLNF